MFEPDMDSNPTCPKRVCIRDTDASSSNLKDENQHIQVFVRVRPMNNHEKSNNSHTVLDCPGTKEVVVKERSQRTPFNMTKTFTFDRVFGPNSKQIEIYKSVVAPLLEEVLLGYNCTVFAYGQTGTGKTYTMEGDRQYDGTLCWDKDPLSGIVPRALNQLFDELRMQKVEFTVRVSLLELYNEELFDLLASTENTKLKNLRLYEDNSRKGSVVIQGLEEVTVHDKHEVYSIMEKGAMKRQTAATLMNEKSSRSHTVFTVTVHIKESNMEGEELLKIGKLHLVDLAGSENIGRSGAVDKRAREAGSINQSLLTLGRVITALVERTPHVPYRESKLTRILQDSLGGRTKTSIIATVSPASLNIEETLNTLDYAHRAKNITNRPEINQKLTKKAILKAYTEEIEQLKKDLIATREKNGIFLDKGNYDRMVNQLDAQGQDISERITLIKSLEETVEKKEEELESTKAILTEKEESLEAANQIIHNLKLDLMNTENELRLTRVQRNEKHHLMSKHMDTERKLCSEASQLLETANSTTLSLEKLYSKLERKRRIEECNLNSGQLFKGDLTRQLMSSLENFVAFRTEHSKLSGEQRLDLESFLNSKTTQFDQLKQSVMKVAEQATCGLANLTKLLTKHVSDTNTWTEAANNAVDFQKQSFVSYYELLLSDLHSTQDLMSNLVTDMFKTHQTLIDETLQFARDAETGFGTIMNDFVHTMTLIWSSFDQYITVHDQDIVLLQQEISHLKSVEDSHQHGFEIEMKRLEESFQTIKVGQKRFHKSFKENSNSLKTKVETINQDGKTLSTNLQNDLEVAKSRILLSKTNFCQPFEGFRSNMASGNSEFVSKSFDVQNAVTKQRDDVNNGLKTAQEMHSDFAEDLKIRHQTLDKEESLKIGILKKGTSDIASRLSLKVMELEEQVQTGLNTDQMMVEKLKEEILQECNWASNWTEFQANKTSEHLRTLSEYFESTYLVDLPSGSTPPRKVYEYPQKLTVTSPHELILSRFREQTSSDFQDVSSEIEEAMDETTNPRTDSLNKMDVVPIQILDLDNEGIPKRTDAGDETEQLSTSNSEVGA